MNSTEIDKNLEELLWSYRQFYLESANDLSTDTRDKLRTASETAFHALQSAFGHQSTFNGESLLDESPAAFEKHLEILKKWAKELEWPEEANGFHSMTAETEDEYTDLLSEAIKPNLWPFINVVWLAAINQKES
jgi:hypothetical protein